MFQNLDTTFVQGKKYISVDQNGFSGLTLDYTCLQCHITKDVNWAASYASNIHQIGVSVDEENSIPTAFTLSQNYPNPFNPTTRIDYSIALAGNVTINVYSITGELVRTIIDEYQNPGRYSVNFNAEGLSSGVYIYKISATNFGAAKKMVVLK